MGAFVGLELAYHSSGAALALADTDTAGSAVDTRDADLVWVSLVISGTAPSTVPWYLAYSDDSGSTYHRLPAVASTISSGTIDHDLATYAAPVTSSSMGPVSVPPGAKIRMTAKKTGGDATTKLLAKFHLVSSR